MLFKHNLLYGKYLSPDGDSGGGGASPTGQPDDPNTDPPTGDPDDGPEDETAGLKSALEKERTNRRTAQREIRDLKKVIADLQKGKPESGEASLEEAIKRAEAAEGRLREANARMAITDAAVKAGAVNAKALLRYVMSDVDFDDQGNPVGIDDLIESARADVPELFAPGRKSSGDGGKGAPVTGQKDINSAFRALRNG